MHMRMGCSCYEIATRRCPDKCRAVRFSTSLHSHTDAPTGYRATTAEKQGDIRKQLQQNKTNERDAVHKAPHTHTPEEGGEWGTSPPSILFGHSSFFFPHHCEPPAASAFSTPLPLAQALSLGWERHLLRRADDLARFFSVPSSG